MGSDYHLNPPPPPPIWKQVKALQDRYVEQSATIKRQKEEIQALNEEKAALERTVARLSVQVSGQPFSQE